MAPETCPLLSERLPTTVLRGLIPWDCMPLGGNEAISGTCPRSLASSHLTPDSILDNVIVDVHEVAAGLKCPPVGIEVEMSHRLLDADAEAHVLLGEGVDGVHKVRIIRRQAVGRGHAFEEGASRIKTCGNANGGLGREFLPRFRRLDFPINSAGSGYPITRRAVVLLFSSLTCDSANLLPSPNEAASEARDVSSQAVANEVSVASGELDRVLGEE